MALMITAITMMTIKTMAKMLIGLLPSLLLSGSITSERTGVPQLGQNSASLSLIPHHTSHNMATIKPLIGFLRFKYKSDIPARAETIVSLDKGGTTRRNNTLQSAYSISSWMYKI